MVTAMAHVSRHTRLPPRRGDRRDRQAVDHCTEEHRSVAMVRRYIRDGSLFRENAAAKIGL
jgi:hypothetical protein